MPKVKFVRCESCGETVEFRKNVRGKWTNVIAGSGVGASWGYRTTVGLGIAGAIAGAPISVPAALVGLTLGATTGGLLMAATHKQVMRCPACEEEIEL